MGVFPRLPEVKHLKEDLKKKHFFNIRLFCFIYFFKVLMYCFWVYVF